MPRATPPPARPARPGDHPRLAQLQSCPQSARAPGDYFSDLTYLQQQVAQRYLSRWLARWGSDCPPWRRAILIGTARRLALHPPPANFGYRLHAQCAAKRHADLCRREGREHPHITAMNRANAWRRAGRPPGKSGQLPLA